MGARGDIENLLYLYQERIDATRARRNLPRRNVVDRLGGNAQPFRLTLFLRAFALRIKRRLEADTRGWPGG